MFRNHKMLGGGLGLRLTELDGDVTFQLVLEANSVDAGDGFNNCRLSVRHMTDRSNVYRSLS